MSDYFCKTNYVHIIVWLFLFITANLLISCATLPTNDNHIHTLTEQYTQLRARQKALPVGVFDKELNGSLGQMVKVLTELGKQLGKPEYQQEDIIRLLGKPDAIKVAGDYQPRSIGDDTYEGIIPKNEVFLIYFWRGWHDYLYFVSKNGIIQQARWYFAGE